MILQWISIMDTGDAIKAAGMSQEYYQLLGRVVELASKKHPDCKLSTVIKLENCDGYSFTVSDKNRKVIETWYLLPLKNGEDDE